MCPQRYLKSTNTFCLSSFVTSLTPSLHPHFQGKKRVETAFSKCDEQTNRILKMWPKKTTNSILKMWQKIKKPCKIILTLFLHSLLIQTHSKLRMQQVLVNHRQMYVGPPHHVSCLLEKSNFTCTWHYKQIHFLSCHVLVWNCQPNSYLHCTKYFEYVLSYPPCITSVQCVPRCLPSTKSVHLFLGWPQSTSPYDLLPSCRPFSVAKECHGRGVTGSRAWCFKSRLGSNLHSLCSPQSGRLSLWSWR